MSTKSCRCYVCGKKIVSKNGSPAKFCSKRCNDISYHARKKLERHHISYAGKTWKEILALLDKVDKIDKEKAKIRKTESIKHKREAVKKFNEAKREEKRKAKMAVLRTCLVCGKKFHLTREQAALSTTVVDICSTECRKKFRAARIQLNGLKEKSSGLTYAEMLEKIAAKRSVIDARKAKRHTMSAENKQKRMAEFLEKREARLKAKMERIQARKDDRRNRENDAREIAAKKAESLGLTVVRLKCLRCGREYPFIIAPGMSLDAFFSDGKQTKRTSFCSSVCYNETSNARLREKLEKEKEKTYDRHGNRRLLTEKEKETIVLHTTVRGSPGGFYTHVAQPWKTMRRTQLDAFLSGYNVADMASYRTAEDIPEEVLAELENGEIA